MNNADAEDGCGPVPLDGIALPDTGELALELLSGYGALDPGEIVVGRLPDSPLGEIDKGTGMVPLELRGAGEITELSSVVELRVEVVVYEVSVAARVNVSVIMRVEEIVLVVGYNEVIPVPKPVTDDGDVPVGPASLEAVVFDSGYGAVLDVPVSVAGAALAPEL